MEEIKVSVIVPVYNTEKYLVECMDSICNQTLREIEILVVNDESTDGSLAILESYAKKDCRVRIIQNVHEGEGAASARNAGLKVAKGKYLSFLDADDFFVLDMLEKFYNKAEKCNTDITMCNYYYFSDKTKSIQFFYDTLRYPNIGKKEVFCVADCPDEILLYNMVVWPKLFKRSFVVKENLEFKPSCRGDDVWFVSSALTMAQRICVVTEPLIYYRVHEASRLSKTKNNPFAMLDILVYTKENLKNKKQFQPLKNGYANQMTIQFFGDTYEFHQFTGYEEYFNALQSKYFNQLELKDYFSHNACELDVATILRILESGTKEEYLFELLNHQKRKSICIETDVIFPYHLVEKTDKVILYGAGNIGIAMYLQNVQGNYCKLVGWVDKNADQKQYPVEGLDILQTRECDKIIVAIDNQAVFQAVYEYLISLSFKKEQIINAIPTI